MTMQAIVAVLNTGSGYYILMNREKKIEAFHTLQEGLNYFETGYRECHDQGYQRSMHATISWMFSKPKILEFPGGQEGIQELMNKFKGRIMTLSGMAGHYVTLELHQETLKKYYDELGVEPKLI